jgi:cell division protein FtsN
VSSEHEEYQEEEPEEYAPRSIFAAGWFRAVLVLTVLAIVVVVALPYLLNWFDPTPSPVKGPGRMAQMMESSPLPAAAPRPQSPPAARPEPAPAATATPPAPERSAAIAAPGPTTPTAEVQVARAAESSRAPDRAATPSKSTAVRPEYWVQLGLFKDPKNADELAKRLRGEGVAVQIVNVTKPGGSGVSGGTYHVVRAGAFRDLPRAAVVKRELQSRGHEGFITEGAAR